ncbi:MAG: metallophosphoesterase family protein [Gammaproteobacteria bacterium]|nr:metallophosphoesterase family protein [Gammaproteobacteria bacterium]
MRIGIVSDLHGNIAGLDTALERMGDVDEIWCPGDAFNQYQFSNEVVGRLREIGARYILGNHEEILLSPAGSRAREREGVDRELLEWVQTRPYRIDETIDAKRIVMFHSTPWEPYGDYLYPHSAELSRLGELTADIAIYGHTHTKLAREIQGTLVVNPGSAGLGQDPRNGRRLSYAVLDTETADVEFDDFDNPAYPKR